jgi:hypothetical protein
MKKDTEKHPEESQLLMALVDEKELPPDIQKHFNHCQDCAGQLQILQEALETLGSKTEENVPPMTRKVYLEEENIGFMGWRYQFGLPSYGALAIVACALLIFFWPRPEYSQNDQFSGSVDFVEDELIMQEIGNLIENPLPEDLKDMTSDMIIGFDNDFLEFIVPDFIDDVHSYNHDRGGEMKC